MAQYIEADVISDPDDLSATIRVIASVSATDISGNGATVTVTTSGEHYMINGDSVTISGSSTFDGTYDSITRVSSTSFTFADTNSATGETGNVTEARKPADEVLIDAAAKKIYLVVDGSNGLKEAGVTLKCLYSFLKEQWKDAGNASAFNELMSFPFPMGPITDEQFELLRGWNFDNTLTSGTGNDGSGVTTPYLVRTGGWAVVNANGNDEERWFSCITLGELDANDQVYFRQVDPTTDFTTAPTDFLLEGKVNQAVQFYSDTNADGTPDYDYSTLFTTYLRTWNKTYQSSTLSAIGAGSGVTYQAYRFPLLNATDVKITSSEAASSGDTVAITGGSHTSGTTTIVTAGHSFAVGDVIDVAGMNPSGYDATEVTITAVTATDISYAQGSDPGAFVSGGTVSGSYYNNMEINWANTVNTTSQTGFNSNFPTSIPTAYFTVEIDALVAAGTNPTAEQIYEFVQAQLRKTTNINASSASGPTTGNRRGDITPAKLQFVGDDLYTLGVSALYEGVYIVDFKTTDRNRLHFWGYGSEQSSAQAISTISRTGATDGIVTVDTAVTGEDGFETGDYVTIVDTTLATGTVSFNGTFGPITESDANTFTYTQTGSNDAATGTNSVGSVQPAEFTNITFPFIATLTINFSQTLINEGTNADYKVYFDSVPSGSYPGPTAIVVQDPDGDPMQEGHPDIGAGIPGGGSATFQFDYDGNTQGGRTAETDAPVTVVAIGLSNAQYITATTTIGRNVTNSVTLTAPLERNYDNPL